MFLMLVISLLPVAGTAGAGDLAMSGFLQGVYGGALNEDNRTGKDYTVSETRLQLRLESYQDRAEFFGRLDFVSDQLTDTYDWELREGYLKFTLFSDFDFKIGRQILTWGTGDLIFINDVFAKDYQSFFAGRDDQYLKAPQTAMRVEYYSPLGALSLVWTPRFTPNRFPVGERFSYYNPMVGDYVGGEQFFFSAAEPELEWENGELAARLQRSLSGFAVALYGYRGFYKNPVGVDIATMMPYYPELDIYGASARGQLAGGILWLEGGYFHSREDKEGDNPAVPNSIATGMIGYERQIATDLTANLQYQAEYMLAYDNYQATLTGPDREDELRSLITSRLTRTFSMETVIASSFVFWSPSDEDVYWRFAVDYKYNDAVKLTVGGNIFAGDKEYTDFGGFDLNDNLYAKLTYGF
jgi:hypothetical protein